MNSEPRRRTAVLWHLAAVICGLLAVFFVIPAVVTNKLNLGVSAMVWAALAAYCWWRA